MIVQSILVRATTVFAIATALAAGAVMAAGTSDNEHAVVEHPELAGKRLLSRELFDPAEEAPGFQLIDLSGEPLSLTDLRGSVVALSFAYTRCPDVCPLLFAQYLDIQKKVPGVADGSVVLLLVTMDPEWDTAERLDSLTRSLNAQWHYLSGERSSLEQVWDEYDIFVTQNEQNVIQHDYKIYLIDQAGNLRIRYGGAIRDRRPGADINALLEG